MQGLKLHDWQARYQRQHGTKLRYRNQAAANCVAATMEEKCGVPLHSYRCPFCGDWHNGSDRRRH